MKKDRPSSNVKKRTLTYSQKLLKRYLDFTEATGMSAWAIDKETGINYRSLIHFKKGKQGLSYEYGMLLLKFLKEKENGSEYV